MDIIFNYSAELLILLFLVITFLQSGVDKIIDWKGNLSWLKGHFKESPLKNIVPLMLGVVLLAEIIAGLLSAVGIYQIVLHQNTKIGFYGAFVSCVSLLMLLFGQRMAKDYEGARTIVIYFIPTVFLVFLLQS